MSSWLGGLLLQVGEWIIRKLPLVKHIYSAAKQAPARPAPPPLNPTLLDYGCAHSPPGAARSATLGTGWQAVSNGMH